MKIQDLRLKFTDGWFRHFKGRHGLHHKKAHGEAKSADFAAGFLSKSPNVLSAIAVIPLTVNKIASSGGFSPLYQSFPQ